jgi:hypothetical protein
MIGAHVSVTLRQGRRRPTVKLTDGDPVGSSGYSFVLTPPRRLE